MEEIILYPFGGKMRILCTARLVWGAYRDGMSLFRSAFGCYYWAVHSRTAEDSFIADPRDFMIKYPDGRINYKWARKAAPTDYFILRK